jgi:hypothetical protein
MNDLKVRNEVIIIYIIRITIKTAENNLVPFVSVLYLLLKCFNYEGIYVIDPQ